MNRAERRRAQRAGVPELALRYAERYACPDCTAETSLTVIDGLPVLKVRHDDTCPAYRKRVVAP